MTRKPLLLPLLLLAAGCMDTSGGSDAGTLTQEIRGLTMYEFRSGKTEWSVTAKRAVLSDASSTAQLFSPEVQISKRNKLTARIKANKGVVDIEKKTVTLLENVDGVSETEKVTIKTMRLDFDIDRDLIWTDQPITLTQSGVKVKGQGFSAKPDLSEIEIKKQETSLPKTADPAKLARTHGK